MDSQPPWAVYYWHRRDHPAPWEQSGFLPRAGGKELENGPSAEQQAQERAIDGIRCHNAQALGLVRLASAARCNLIELELRALRLELASARVAL